MNEEPPGREKQAVTYFNTKIEDMARDAIAGSGHIEITAEAIILEGKVFPPTWGSAVLVLAVLVVGHVMRLLGVVEDILVAVIVPLLYLWIGSRQRRLVLANSTIREVRYNTKKQTVTLIADQHAEDGSAPTSITFRIKKKDEFETISENLRRRLPPGPGEPAIRHSSMPRRPQ